MTEGKTVKTIPQLLSPLLDFIMSLPMPVIAFGPSPGIYFVAVGMKYYAVGLPDSIRSTASKWPAPQMRWMSINADCAWMVQDMYSSTLEFDTSIGSDLIQKCRGTSAFQYVTFGPTRNIWLGVGPDNSGVWSGSMEDDQLRALQEMQAQIGDSFNFNTELRGILFGKGSTMIYMFRGSFAYYTDREAEGGELENLLNSYIYRSPPWTVQRGSALCPWDVNYYFLKFKDPQSSTVKMHWSLPPDMKANYDELSAWAQTPEAQAAIAQNQQLGLALTTSTLNLNFQAANALKISTGWYSYGPHY